ncbi:MAG: hypothetical protein WAZ18_01435 [Alphaproteobacteria bacterium]
MDIPKQLQEIKSIYIKSLAELARQAVRHGITDVSFSQILRAMIEADIISVNSLAMLSRVERSTASRWVHGHNAPSTLSQETILLRIADIAETSINPLHKSSETEPTRE